MPYQRMFPVFEAETGEVVSSTPIRHRVPVAECPCGSIEMQPEQT